jgi:transposase-like protein
VTERIIQRARAYNAPQPPTPLPQLDLTFDAAAEHARRASSGQECPACESSTITTQGNQWHCHACGVNWNKPEANQ